MHRRTIQKNLNDPDNHDDMITHLELDVLEYKVKWALGSITRNKASGGNGIPAELLRSKTKILWKCCTKNASKFGKLSSGHKTEKVSFHSNPKGGQHQECSHYWKIVLNSHSSKFILKIFQAKFQQYMNQELSDVQAGFICQRNQRSNCQHS